jgi:hypothetical protein
MTFRTFWTTALVLAAMTPAACSRQPSDADQRLAELEKQLAETQQKLAEQGAKPDAAPPAATNPSGAPAAATVTQKPSAPPTQKPSAPPTQKPAAPALTKAEADKLVNQQQEVNAKQAETNAELQKQVEQLKPREYTLAAGTIIPVRTSSELSTARVKDGSSYEAILERDLKAGDVVLAPARSRVTGVVVTSDPGGRVKGTASLTIGVRSIVGPKGQVIAISTDTYEVDAASTKKKDAVRTGIATGVGALIGGIAGGGQGAAIGAGAGAAAGVGTNMATRGASAVIPAEELIEFRLTSPVTVVVQP